jgi:hypothetical protein
LLTYKNCPKQYYINNIEKLGVEDKFQVLLTEGKKGEIYHTLLQDIGTDSEKLNLYLNSKIELESYLKSHSEFRLESNDAAVAEVIQIVQHTLKHWKEMPIFNSDWKVLFEEEFQSQKMDDER